jgi:hypothetical protein
LTGRTGAAACAAIAICAFAVWHYWVPSEERAVRGRLGALTEDVNTTVTGGLGAVVHAADVGSYFTDDVVVDLGEGAAPIVGRATLVGMVSRLQRRTASFRIRFDDVGVRVDRDATSADVKLTASFVAPDEGAGGESMDAREFALAMRKIGGVWRIAHVAAVDTLR